MIVMVLEKVTASVKGELTRWLFEVRPGVYVGHVSALVRDKLWEQCINRRGEGRVFQAWSTNNEQHFSMRMSGYANRLVVDWEGVQL
ncbi:MAG TPA: type I-E CRISPR-associated endoribonuclease Cas2e, partial [Anaerolineaceae bacterium]|nr:type I-E CRISPR-associated endoribonuclease Cas2e [Anaerolineaceae bacterium]